MLVQYVYRSLNARCIYELRGRLFVSKAYTLYYDPRFVPVLLYSLPLYNKMQTNAL